MRTVVTERLPSLAALLKRRGFLVYKQQPEEDLFVPSARGRDAWYAMLHRYSFRLFLRDVIKHQALFTLADVARYATPQKTQGYIEFLRSLRLIRKTGAGYRIVRPITSFGPTLEWYTAEIFRQDFGAEALWGVKFRRPRVGGDYDVIAGLEGALLYVEVKSSPPKQIMEGEIAAFLDRVFDLAPSLALFLMDTELRMQDKLVPLFAQALAARSAEPPPVRRLERELFTIQDRIFIVNAKGGIVHNCSRVLHRYFQTQVAAQVPRRKGASCA